MPSPRAPRRRCLNPGTPHERALTSKVAGLRLKHGDLLSVEFAGGGGWGDPYRARSRARAPGCRARLRLGAARSDDYGVVLTPDLTIDAGRDRAPAPGKDRRA